MAIGDYSVYGSTLREDWLSNGYLKMIAAEISADFALYLDVSPQSAGPFRKRAEATLQGLGLHTYRVNVYRKRSAEMLKFLFVSPLPIGQTVAIWSIEAALSGADRSLRLFTITGFGPTTQPAGYAPRLSLRHADTNLDWYILNGSNRGKWECAQVAYSTGRYARAQKRAEARRLALVQSEAILSEYHAEAALWIETRKIETQANSQ